MTIEEAIQILTIATDNAELSVAVNNSENYFRKLNEACQLAADELRKRQWISVKDRLPEREDDYLVCFEDGFIATTSYKANENGETDWELWADSGEPTHWMPLLEPPKEREENA